ncbi:MAG: PadR family transcriptional regulator [Gemmatimonadota bacterium]
MTDGDAAAFQPLKPNVFEILLALEGGDLHGYGILKVTEERGVPVAASLLYRKLKRLMESGLVEESPREPTAEEDSRRRYYRLTALGLEVVRAEARRIVELAESGAVRRLAKAGGRSV